MEAPLATPRKIQEDIDLAVEWQKRWADARVSLSKAYGREIGAAKSLDDVLEQIYDEKRSKENGGPKHDRAKKAVDRTLTCITTLAGIASQAASMMFGPSDTCFNAVSFMVDTWRMYRHTFDTLAELFEEVSAFLERFKVYKRMEDMVDIGLKKIVNEGLFCFVSICQVSHKVLKHKASLFAKIVFLREDEGVEGELTRLKGIVEKENAMNVALIHESSKVNETRLKRMDQDQKKKTAEDKENFEDLKNANRVKEQKDKVKKLLGNPEEKSKYYSDTASKKIEDTGQWFISSEPYTTWSDRDRESEQFLLLQGERESGKSFLMFTTIPDLQQRHTRDSSANLRVSVAYHFFTLDAARSGGISLDKALKSLAYQIAEQDPVYLKSLSSCQHLEGVANLNGLWDVLFENHATPNTLFYFIIDGIDQIEDEHDKLKALGLLAHINELSNGKGSRFRFLITGTPATTKQIRLELKDTMLLTDVDQAGDKDIELFIESRVSDMPIFKDASPEVAKVKEEVLESLLNVPKKTFKYTDHLLRSIGNKQTPSQIKQVLSEALSGAGYETSVKREINDCNIRLSVEEKDELNLLLTWVVCGEQVLWVKELESVLHLKRGEPSLQRLGKKIQGSYSTFFSVDGDDNDEGKASVHIQSDAVIAYLDDLAEQKKLEANSGSKDVNKFEVDIVRRFLFNVCDKDLFERFGFEDFFNRKLNDPTNSIALDRSRAPLTILSGCLKAICTDSPAADDIRWYAFQNLCIHLDAVDFFIVDGAEKAELGRYLVKMFRDPMIMDRYYDSNYESFRRDWMFTDNNTEMVMSWLKDPFVIAALDDSDKDWVRSLLYTNHAPEANILAPYFESLGRNVLKDIDCTTRGLYGLLVYKNKIDHKRDEEKNTRYIDDDEVEAALGKHEIVEEVVEWIASTLKLEHDFEWHFCSSEVYEMYGWHDKAIEEAKLAIDLSTGGNQWRAKFNLANSYDMKKDFQLSKETAMELRASMLEATEETDLSGVDKKDLQHKTLKIMASAHVELKETSGAIEVFETIIREFPDDYQAVCDLSLNLVLEKRFEQLFYLFESLKSTMDEGLETDRLTATYYNNIHNEEYHNKLLKAVANHQSIKPIWEHIIARVRERLNSSRGDEKQDSAWRLAGLLYVYACMLLRYQPGDEARMEAIEALEEIVSLSLYAGDDYFYKSTKVKAAKRLATEYAVLALKFHGSEESSEYLPRLKELAGTDDLSGEGLVLLEGRIHSLYDRADDAKSSLRSSLQIGFDLLCDEDPENDFIGYQRIASVMMYSGDYMNATAAWSLVLPTKKNIVGDRDNGDDDSSGDTDGAINTITYPTAMHGEFSHTQIIEKGFGPVYICDGCGVQWAYGDDLYLCLDCLDVGFDGKCVEALRNGEMEKMVCSKEHKFFHVPPYNKEKAAELPEGYVLVGDQTMPVSDWISLVKKDWGLSDESNEKDQEAEGG